MHMSARNKVLNNLGHWTKFTVMKQWTTRSRNWKFTTSTPPHIVWATFSQSFCCYVKAAATISQYE